MLKELAPKDVVIIGGGTGGVAAAEALLQQGKTVAMSEEYPWIGGQLTSQAIPPDEHPYFDQPNPYGGTRRYQELRQDVRDYYKEHYPLTEEARDNPYLNPGNGWVGPICAEFPVFLNVLNSRLAPFIYSGQLTLLREHIPVGADVNGDYVRSVTIEDKNTGDRIELSGDIFIDATECGDLLPLTGTEHVTGAESYYETGEPSAPDVPEPDNVQGITYTFALEYRPGEDHTIDRPEMYDFWLNYTPDLTPPWPGRLLSLTTPKPWSLEPETKTLFLQEGEDDVTRSLFRFRQIRDRHNFLPPYDTDITLVNWPQNDYWLGRIYDVPDDEKERSLYEAKQLSMSLLYWLQKDAPHPDGNGQGYPSLMLRPDLMGTEDGLAQAPYVREARRIKAETTLLEHHIRAEDRGDRGPELFPDSIGVRSYKMDSHPTTGRNNYRDVPTYDSQLSLGMLIPLRMENLLPAEKNVGTTHITNGGTRLHPIVWNLGEAAGELAAYCLDSNSIPREVRQQVQKLEDFQRRLRSVGVELAMPQYCIRG